MQYLPSWLLQLLTHLIIAIFWQLVFAKLGWFHYRRKHVLGASEVKAKEEHDFSRTWPNDLGFDTVREQCKPVTLSVSGHIPAYASGTIYRNGPGARELRNSTGQTRYSCSHWFDGFGQLHKFELVPGEAGVDLIIYSSRFSADLLMQQVAETGEYAGYTFAQKRDPCMGMFRKVMCLFTPAPKLTARTGNIPVTVSANSTGFPATALSGGHRASKAGHLIARTDEGYLKALDMETLEPIGLAQQAELHPLLKGPLSASHAKSDPVTGDVFNYNLDIGAKAVYRVFKTSAITGETDILAAISGPNIKPAYMHSFFLTENFVILCIWSAHLTAGGIRVLWEKNVLDAIAPFDHSRSAQWLVIDRQHGRGVVAAFESPATFCFHTINAYEVPHKDESGRVDITCDLIQYDNLDVLHKFYYENMRSSSPAAANWIREKQTALNQRFSRYQLSCIPAVMSLSPLTKHQREHKSPLPQSRQVQLLSTIGSHVAGELPTINPAYATKPYRYFWCCLSDTTKSTFMDGLCKVDTTSGMGVKWDNPPGHSPGEAIFVADPNGADEDDGVLLTIVLDGFSGTSYLLCLDARTMQELGRADCKGVIPFTFHGQHVKDGERPLDV